MKKEPTQPERVKFVFEDQRLQQLDQLSREELETLEKAISLERNNKIAPLERLCDEYFKQWQDAGKVAGKLGNG